jgi:probable F420-dependent oxidoreductase
MATLAGPALRFGCHLPTFGPIATRDAVLAFARRMEALGYDSLWASDHIVLPYAVRSRYPYSETGQFPLPPAANFLEPLTTLALVAGVTERVRLGTTILVLPHRHPLLAAKMVSTLDHLSGGRVTLGVGVGWMREEIEMLGGPYDGRGAWSDEAIRVMRACWESDRARFAGRFFSFDEIGMLPRPAQTRVPILVGGESAAALRRVVALGDGWHTAFPSPAALGQGLRRLREECARQGRAFEDLAITMRAGLSIRPSPLGPDRRPLQGSAEEIAGDLRGLAAQGVHEILLETRQRTLEDMVSIFETFAREIRPRLGLRRGEGPA